MCPETTDQPRAVAVAQLEDLGLSSYAARTYVALSALGSGTARDVSQVSEVPRTRVYDAVEELRKRGLVDIRQSSPKKFWATSAETASRSFERELQQRTERLRASLDEIGPAAHHAKQQGVWTVAGEAAVSQRILDFFADAQDEIVFMTVEGLLTDELIAGLRDAAKRGVSIKLGGVSPAVQAEIQSEIPDATTFESLWLWSDTSAGRLLMTDRTQTLVSALVNGQDGSASDPRSETAIWGRGDTNSLVVVLRAIFAWRLQQLE